MKFSPAHPISPPIYPFYFALKISSQAAKRYFTVLKLLQNICFLLLLLAMYLFKYSLSCRIQVSDHYHVKVIGKILKIDRRFLSTKQKCVI